MRNEILTDGKSIYMVLHPTINGVMTINEDGNKAYLAYPVYKGMKVI